MCSGGQVNIPTKNNNNHYRDSIVKACAFAKNLYYLFKLFLGGKDRWKKLWKSETQTLRMPISSVVLGVANSRKIAKIYMIACIYWLIQNYFYFFQILSLVAKELAISFEATLPFLYNFHECLSILLDAKDSTQWSDVVHFCLGSFPHLCQT